MNRLVKKHRLALAGAAFLISLTAGCAAGNESTAKFQDQLEGSVESGAHMLDVTLDCPAEVADEDGATFDCTFKGTPLGPLGPERGTSLPGSVTVTVETAGGSNFTYEGEYVDASGSKKTFDGWNGTRVVSG